MIVASFGGGTNSAAMLIGMHERGEKVDLITSAILKTSFATTKIGANRFGNLARRY